MDVYRDPVGSENPAIPVFLGSAAFVSGSRTDVENLYPNTPLNYRGGWGFMVLTNMLPDIARGRPTGGNGTFRLHAYAVDLEGMARYLGTKRFTANNSAATRPFGSIDTPAQGGTASGGAYMVFGWAISPRTSIPTNGSSITVYVDGNAVGHPTYNQYRSDIATMFPGYANSNGAVGYLPLNTTLLSNGTHTISWVVTDSQGNSEGIGSRFFTVQNGATGAVTAAAVEQLDGCRGDAQRGSRTVGRERRGRAARTTRWSRSRRSRSDDPTPQLVFPESQRHDPGEVGRDRARRSPRRQSVRRGRRHLRGLRPGHDGRLRSLPVGSSLNKETGVFKWQPGPGFIGTYELVFVRTLSSGFKTKVPVTITIAPKFER